jgi:hypothetical protein
MIASNRLHAFKVSASFVFFAVCAIPLLGSQEAGSLNSAVFRDPFTLKLHLDKKNTYEKEFGRVPYVDGMDVYLFSGDNFGVNVTTSGDEITGLRYERNPDKAEIKFNLTEQVHGDRAGMSLIGWNKLKRAVYMDALMTTATRDGIRPTNIVPMRPSAGSYEVWPEPIVQLVIHNIRFSPQASAQQPRTAPQFMSATTSH